MLLERSDTQHDGRVRREVRALAGAGHEVVLLHHGRGDQTSLRADGATTRSVRPGGAGRLPGHVARLALWARYAWVAARLRPDVVHAHDLTMLAPGWLAARTTGAQLLYDTHEYADGVPYRSPIGRRIARRLQRALVRRCAVVVTVSPGSSARLQADHGLGQAPAVVRNVPLREWPGAPGAAAPVADLRAELEVGAAPLVLHQGAAAPGRGCLDLIAAAARLEGVHLLFLGDPDPGFAGELRAAAARAGAAERVHLRPSVPLEVLLAHTRQADVGVCLSDPRWENHRLTLSNKLFEYIAAGLPVVATAGTDFGALVEERGVGVTVPFSDAGALADGIARALAGHRDEALRERLAAAGAELTWEREQERLLDAYGLLRSRSRSRQAARSAT